MINCVGKENSCGGGWHGSAFNHLVKYGAPFPDAEGNVIKRYAPTDTPAGMAKDIEAALAA